MQISMNKSVYSKDYKEIIERLKTARIERIANKKLPANSANHSRIFPKLSPAKDDLMLWK